VNEQLFWIGIVIVRRWLKYAKSSVGRRGCRSPSPNTEMKTKIGEIYVSYVLQ